VPTLPEEVELETLTAQCLNPVSASETDGEETNGADSSKMSNALYATVDGQGNEDETVVAVSLLDGVTQQLPLSQLPPLPSPRLSVQRQESLMGNGGVTFIVGMVIGMTYLVTIGWLGGSSKQWIDNAATTRLWCLAAAAMICLLGIFFADPGTIKRSEATCLPIPSKVQEQLQSLEPGVGVTDMENINGEDGRTFCTRCLVWRPHRRNIHHCRVCNRCVMEFDHHCGFFGRCIAGNICPPRGNLPFFYAILAVGFAAEAIAFIFFLAAFASWFFGW